MKLVREGRIGTSRGFTAIAVAGLFYSLWAFYGAGIEAGLWSLAMTADRHSRSIFVMRAASRSSPAAAAGPAASRE
jgi:APA family basic amino acid/polyamine antiporter